MTKLDSLSFSVELNSPDLKAGILYYSGDQPSIDLVTGSLGTVKYSTATITEFLNGESKITPGELLVISGFDQNSCFTTQVLNQVLVDEQFLYNPDLRQLTEDKFLSKHKITRDQCLQIQEGYQTLRDTIQSQFEQTGTLGFYPDGSIGESEGELGNLFEELICSALISMINNRFKGEPIFWVMPGHLLKLLYQDDPNYGLYNESLNGYGIFSLEDEATFGQCETAKMNKKEIMDRYGIILGALPKVLD